MAVELKPGDVVRVKSGGPYMTVNKVDKKGQTGLSTDELWAWCDWFEEGKEDKPKNGSFQVVVLEFIR